MPDISMVLDSIFVLLHLTVYSLCLDQILLILCTIYQVIVISKGTWQQGYRRDTSEVVVQDHIGKWYKMKTQEYIITMPHLIAMGKCNDVIACTT